MVSIRTMEVKEGPQTFRCPSLLCYPIWAGLMRQTAAPLVEMSLWWTVPGRETETMSPSHSGLLREENKADLWNQEKTCTKTGSQTSNCSQANAGTSSLMNSIALTWLLFTVFNFKWDAAVRFILAYTLSSDNWPPKAHRFLVCFRKLGRVQ